MKANHIGLRMTTEGHGGWRDSQRKAKDYKLLWFSLASAFFFLTLFLLWEFRIQVTIIGVFQELLTLPMMAAQIVLLVFVGIKLSHRAGRTNTNLLALIISFITTFFILQSFWS